MALPRLLTVDQVAEHMQVEPFTVRKWLRVGRLAGIKMHGHVWRIEESEVGSFIDRLRTETSPGRKATKAAGSSSRKPRRTH